MRVMAVDFGDARTGIAISDPTGSITGITRVIHQRHPEKVAEETAALVRQYAVAVVVVGLPRNMNGTEGPRAALCREFAVLLEARCGLKPVLWDERLTTVAAHAILSANDRHGKKRKNTVDAVAASLILEGYLAAGQKNGGDETDC